MRLIDADALWHDMETAEWYDNADRDEVAEPLILSSQTIGGWISVDDKLPEQKECYLVYRSNFWGEYDGQICVCYWDGKYWCDSYEGAGADGFELTPGDVSHWIPLPEPPKEVKKE